MIHLLAALTIVGFMQDKEEKPKDGVEGFRAFLSQLRKAKDGKDAKAAAALAKSLLPDEARLKKVLKDGVDDDTVGRIKAQLDGYKPASDKDEDWMRLIDWKETQTEVDVYAATTEEIAEGQNDAKHFAGGMKQVSGTLLRPKTTYYVVRFREKGQEAGMTYQPFAWDGEQWTLLGKLWRLPEKKK